MFKNYFNSKRGFTLIEMLIVIAIISILSSVFLVGLRGFRGGAYDSRRLADLQKTQSYLEIYYTANRAYPTATSWAGTAGTTLSSMLSALNVSLPNDPISSQSYKYCYSSDKQSYILAATFSATHSALSETSELDTMPTGYTCTTGDTGAPDDCDDTKFNFCIKF